MISAKFLAEIDCRLRSVMRERGTYKLDGERYDRPFGALNVIFAGDFWHLDPPERGCISLSRVPGDLFNDRSKRPKQPTVEYGFSLFWDCREPRQKRDVQGMATLWRAERCKDWWFNQVLEECRSGALTEDNFNFMHGFPTSVPGSWDTKLHRCECARVKEHEGLKRRH